MGYVAVKGGTFAIEESIKRLKYERLRNNNICDVNNIKYGMRGLVDTVMSEASLYSENLAAVAIKQSEGNVEEAVFLIRAYRSTLDRMYYSRIVNSENMFVERRISASFKDILGGQILGASYDYTHRLIDFDLIDETLEETLIWIKNYLHEKSISKEEDLRNLPKVVSYLRNEGIIKNYEENNEEPIDVTKKSIEFPTKRSERLQILTRGQTGAVTSLGYAAIRGYGMQHPTVGELRVGKLPIYIDSQTAEKEEDCYYIGEIKVTEVETFIPKSEKVNLDSSKLNLEVGYGICYGQNETKSIAMSILDRCLEEEDKKFVTQDEEFVLMHIDSVESSGFISHLKLPHYVTFQSKLDSIRKTHRGDGENEN